MKSTFSVIYYLKRQVVKKDGTVPVMGRITVDGSQTQFSCKLTVDPKLWDTKGGRVTGRSTAALEANRMLDKMRVRINRHYQEIMERDNFVTAEKVKNAFLGLEHPGLRRPRRGGVRPPRADRPAPRLRDADAPRRTRGNLRP